MRRLNTALALLGTLTILILGAMILFSPGARAQYPAPAPAAQVPPDKADDAGQDKAPQAQVPPGTNGGSGVPVAPLGGVITVTCNTGAITIPDPISGTLGIANPYPSIITVTGQVGVVSSVAVTLTNLTHSFPDDIDALLVGPGGQHVMLMSDAGGGTDVFSLTLTFRATGAVLTNTGVLTSGTYMPANYAGNDGANDSFVAPAPSPPYTTSLSVFNGTAPNGQWSLFIFDDQSGDSGAISGGWCLELGTTGNATFTPTPVPATPTSTIVVTPSPTPCVPSGGSWSSGAAFPQPNVRSAGVWWPANGRFYLLGGRSSDAAGSDNRNIYEYNPGTNAWVQKTALFPTTSVNNIVAGRLTMSGTTYIVAVGGTFCCSTPPATGDVRLYDPATDTLVTLGSNDAWPAGAISNTVPGGIAVANNKLYMIGGFIFAPVGSEQMVDTIWEFDPARPAGSRWVLKNARLGQELGYVPATTIGNYIYTAGGSTWDGTTLQDSNVAYRYDPVADLISALPNLPLATGETRAVTVGTSMWVLGGGRTAPNPSNVVQIFGAGGWTTGPPFVTARRNFAADTDGAGRIFLVGGYAPAAASTSMEIFQPGPCGTPSATPTQGAGASPTPTQGTGATPTPTQGIGPSPTPTQGTGASPTRTSPPVATATRTPLGATATRTTAAATATSTPCTITFSDVGQSNPFYVFIRCLACRQIVSGYSDGTFRWGAEVTRGQLSKIISGAAGQTNAIPSSQQTFEDVPNTNVFWVFIERLAGVGAISGYNCGGPGEPCGSGNRPYFRWGNNATRGQISKITAVTAGWNGPIPTTQQSFEDVPVTNPFWLWIEELANRQIISGYNCGGPGEPCGPGNRPYFRWGNNATRGQMSKIAAESFFPGCQTPQRK